MPRKTPVQELLEKEEAVVSSPLRRSSRLSSNSPVPTKVTTRRSSASETVSTPKATRGRRSSFSQELEAAKENETENKTTKTTGIRTRRGSLSSKNGEENGTAEEPLTKRTTRASSVTKESTPDVKRPVTRRRRSASQEIEINEELPVTKTRGRSNSVTKKNGKSEDNAETEIPGSEVSISVEKATLDVIEETPKESDLPASNESKINAVKKRKTEHLKVDLDLSVINETSFTEEDSVSGEETKPLPSKDEKESKEDDPGAIPLADIGIKEKRKSAGDNTLEKSSKIQPEIGKGESSPIVENLVEEKSAPLKDDEGSKDHSEVKLQQNVEERMRQPVVVLNRLKETTNEKSGSEIQEQTETSPLINNSPGKSNSEVRNSTISIENKNEEEKCVTTRKEVDLDSPAVTKEAEISPRGNKENICPANQSMDVEPMEVDEPEVENSLSTTFIKTQSPLATKTSKVNDVGKELEIAEKVTDEIDQFLKEDLIYASNSPKPRKSRLSLNRSVDINDEKERSTAQNDEHPKSDQKSSKQDDQVVTISEEKNQIVATPGEKGKEEESSTLSTESVVVSTFDSKDVSKDESKLHSKEKTTVAVDTQEEIQLEDDVEENFRLELTHSPVSDGPEENGGDTEPDVQVKESSNDENVDENQEKTQPEELISNKVVNGNKLEVPDPKTVVETEVADVVSEKQVEKNNETDLNHPKSAEDHLDESTNKEAHLEENVETDLTSSKTTEDCLEESTAIEEDMSDIVEVHLEENVETEQSSVIIIDKEEVVIQNTKQISPVHESTPKIHSRGDNAEDITEMEPVQVTIETDDELEISKSECVVEDSDSVEFISEKVDHEQIQKTVGVNGSSCVIVESESVTNEDTQISLNDKEDTKVTIDSQPEEESIKETDKSLVVDESQELNKEHFAEKQEETDLGNEIKSTENECSANVTPTKSPTLQGEDLNNSKTEIVLKKSPAKVIIKSDIIIQPATVKDESIKETTSLEKSPSCEEKSTEDIEEEKDSKLNETSVLEEEETSEEADTTQCGEDDVFQKQKYKSPQKKITSKLQNRIAESSSSDEEGDAIQNSKDTILTDSKYEAVAKEKQETPKKSMPSVEAVIGDCEDEEPEEIGEDVMEDKLQEVDEKQGSVSSESEEKEVKEVSDQNKSLIDTSKTKKLSPDKTCIVMQQNLKAGDDTERRLSDRIHKVVDLFCAGIQNTNDVAINVSLEFTGHFSDSDDETKCKKDTVEVSLSASASKKDSKEPPVDVPKGSKRRKLYHPKVDEEILNKPKSDERQVDLQEENEEKKVKDKSKNKKSTTFNESNNSVSSPKAVEDEEEFVSPEKKPRPYKDTPYKSSKSSKKTQMGGAKSKEEENMKSDDESPAKKRRKESPVEISEEESDEEEWKLFKKYFSSFVNSDSDSSDDPDSTWGPSREISFSDSDLCSDDSDDTAFEEEEAFIIRSPIPTITSPRRRKTESSEAISGDSEPSFTCSVKSSKSFNGSPKKSTANIKSPSPSKKRRNPQSDDDKTKVETPSKLKNEEKNVELSGVVNQVPKKKKKQAKENENITSLKPSVSSIKTASPSMEKKSKKRTYPSTEVSEESIKAKKGVKPDKAPEIVVSKVPTSKLKVSTNEHLKKFAAASTKKSGKPSKVKYLKPSTSMASNGWEVKKFK